MDAEQQRRRAPEPDFYDDLRLFEQTAWLTLKSAVRDRTSGFHTGTLATVSREGRPVARTVVLREADSATRHLRFHTDIGSSKVAELRAQPRAMMHFYDPGRKLQVQASGTATIHHGDDIARAIWDRVALFSRRCYLGDEKPGGPASDPTPGFPIHLRDARPDAAESEAGFENFAVARLSVDRLEVLFLHARGNRRAAFAYAGDEPVRATWLVP